MIIIARCGQTAVSSLLEITSGALLRRWSFLSDSLGSALGNDRKSQREAISS